MSGLDRFGRLVRLSPRQAAEFVGVGGGTGLPQSIILFGTSIEALNNINNGLAEPNLVLEQDHLSDVGYFTWANLLLGGAFRVARNSGVPGNTTAQMRARLERDVMAVSSGYVLVGGPTNDMLSRSFADIVFDLQYIYDRVVKAGRGLFVCSSLPNTSIAASAAARVLQAQIHAWQSAYCGETPGAMFLDLHTPLVDPDSPTGAPASGVLTDSAHPSLYGAQLLGESIARQLTWRFSRYRINASRADVVSSVAPFGNLLENPVMAGATGQFLDNVAGDVAPTVSGLPPTDWQNWYAAGASTSSVGISHSHPSRDDFPNLQWWQTDVTFPAQAAQVQLWHTSDNIFPIPSVVQPGDLIDFAIELDVSNIVNIGAFTSRVRFRNDAGTELGYAGLQYNQSVNAGPRRAFAGVLRASGVYPSGATRAQVIIETRSLANSAGGYRMRVGNAEIRKRLVVGQA